MKKLTADEIVDRVSSILSDEKEILKLLEALSEISELYLVDKEVERIRVSEAKDFIYSAKNDLKSAKILYEAEIYSTAIYHLQQAVEKFVKAYVLVFFGISKNVLINYVKHDSPKAFFKLIKGFKKYLKFSSMLVERFYGLDAQILKISNQDIRKLESAINKSKWQIAKISSEEIREILNLAVKLKKILESKELKEEIVKCLTKLKDMGILSELDEKIRNEIIATIDKVSRNLGDLLKLYSSFLVLYLLSLITYPHATFTRYPNRILPPKKYDRNLGIVQCFHEIVSLLEEVANSCEFLEV